MDKLTTTLKKGLGIPTKANASSSAKPEHKSPKDREMGKHRHSDVLFVFEKKLSVEVMLRTPIEPGHVGVGERATYDTKDVLCRTTVVSILDREKDKDDE